MRKLRSKQGAAIAAAAIIGAGAGGAAIAASGNGSPFSPSAFLDDLAGRLGVTTQKLKDASKAAALDQVDAALKAGTITQATSGKTVDGLKQAIVDAATKQLEQAVADKRITAAQEQTILADLKSRLDGLVNGTLPTHRFGPDRFSGGPGGPLFRGSRQA